MPSCQNTARLSNAEGPPAAEEEEESISGGGFRCGPDLKTFFLQRDRDWSSRLASTCSLISMG
jgi:hypothetical protein